MVAPSILPGRAFQQTTKTSDLLFHWRASDLSLNAVTGEVGTFTRASVGGAVLGTGIRQWLDTDNQLRLTGQFPSELERYEWALNADGVYVPALRLEGSRVNNFTRSEELNDAVYGKTNVTITPNDTIAPDGATTADKIVEDSDVASLHQLFRNTPTLTDSTTQAMSFYAKADERTFVAFVSVNKANSAITSWFDLGTGVVGTVEAGHTVSIEDAGNGWFRCEIRWASGTGGTTPQILIRIADADNSSTYNGDGVSGIFVWGVQLEVDKPFPSTYVKTVATTPTRVAEILSWTYNALPQAKTFYLKMLDWTGGFVTGVVLHVGSASQFTTPYLDIQVGGAGTLLGNYNNGTGLVTTGAVAAPTNGQDVEFLMTLTALGVLDLAVSLDGGAQVDVAATAAKALPAAWAGTLLHMNSGGSSAVSFGAYESLKGAAGVRSMAYMREAF